ncbi:MAG: RNA-binding protein [Planctomycetes bacterium]|nr:RNA-binding protein [Planctomycetota bacterium]
MNIYVGNIPYDITEDGLRAEFGAFGQVTAVNIITDRESGRPRGFAFVEMANDAEAKSAIDALNGKDFSGRTLKVNEARPREERRSGGGGGPRRGGGGDRFGGGRGGKDRRPPQY